MKTVVLGDPPEALASLIADRKRLGLDRNDEVWQGEYHVAPAPSFEHARIDAALVGMLSAPAASRSLVVTTAFNLGSSDDYRVPDLGVHRGRPAGVWIPSAAVVVEVRSPHDETFDKFDFFFRHGVDEILVVDLQDQSVTWFVRTTERYGAADRSSVVDLSSDAIRTGLGWDLPPT
jgi:Uma2 family endonuclease